MGSVFDDTVDYAVREGLLVDPAGPGEPLIAITDTIA
jgi:hypothetical protein